MVEINNQRKAFLDMLAWSEGTDNVDVMKPEIMVSDGHCRRRAIYCRSGSPRKLVTLNRIKSTGAGRYQLLSRWWMLFHRKAVYLKDFFREKFVTLWHCSRLRSVALYLYDRADIRQAIDRCSNIWPIAGRWLWSVRA